MPKIAAATAALIDAMRQAALKKEALKLAKSACKAAEKECRRARKDSRKTAKLARRAKEKLDKLQRKIRKSKPRGGDRMILSSDGPTPPVPSPHTGDPPEIS